MPGCPASPALSRTVTREILIVRVTRARAQACSYSCFSLPSAYNRKTRVTVRDTQILLPEACVPRMTAETDHLAKQAWMRLELPYGLWTCPEGTEVLFNRLYQPIWQRRPTEAAVAADPAARIAWMRQVWFYMDSNPPWMNEASLAACEGVLADWGLPPPNPRTERCKPSPAQSRPHRDGGGRSTPLATVLPFTRPTR